MKKDMLRAIVAVAVVVVVYHLIAFVAPFVHTAPFWISYVFTLAAIAVMCLSIYIAFMKNPDARSRFYGFPIARIGVLHGCAQLVVSLVVMALGKWIPGWIPTLVYAIGLGAAVIGLISAEAVVEEIHTQDKKLIKDTSLMRTLQSKVNQLPPLCTNPDTERQLSALAEDFRFSDPVSTDALAEIEHNLAVAVDALGAAVVENENVPELCRRASQILAERNRLCKLNKCCK